MKNVAITSESGLNLFFEEDDIRRACGMMRCGEHVEECLDLMRRKATECVLCYAVLQALKKPRRRKNL